MDEKQVVKEYVFEIIKLCVGMKNVNKVQHKICNYTFILI